jgi:hypothetical protein
MTTAASTRVELQASHEEALAAARSALDRAITAHAGNARQWGEALGDATAGLCHAILEHQEAAEAPGGTLEEMGASAPHLESRIRRQKIDHAVLLSEAANLEAVIRAQVSDGYANVRELRDRATYLLDRVRMHIAEANDLIYEAYFSEIGGES